VEELRKLFPEENRYLKKCGEEVSGKEEEGADFDSLIRKYNFSNEFIATLKQMLKLNPV
jgi:hypothetical protein